VAPGNIDVVNAPAFAGATVVASHPPAQPSLHNRGNGQVHCGRDEATRVAAPSLPTSDGTTSLGADCAVVAAHRKAPSSSKDVLECVATVGAELQHTTVKAKIGFNVRCFEIEVVSENYLW